MKTKSVLTGLRNVMFVFVAMLVAGSCCFDYSRLLTMDWTYFRYCSRAGNRIVSLIEQTPPNVDPDVWDEAVGWSSTVFGNVTYTSEDRRPSREQLIAFYEELERRTQGEMGLDLHRWIWDALADTCPHAWRYAHRWRPIRLLCEVPITDESLPTLWGLSDAAWLDLDDTEITDEGLDHLHGLPHLRGVSLRNTRVTPEGIRRLKQAMPDLGIEFSPAPPLDAEGPEDHTDTVEFEPLC